MAVDLDHVAVVLNNVAVLSSIWCVWWLSSYALGITTQHRQENFPVLQHLPTPVHPAHVDYLLVVSPWKTDTYVRRKSTNREEILIRKKKKE